MLPGAEFLILAPFLATLVLSWAFFYDAERAIHDSRPWRPELAPESPPGSTALSHASLALLQQTETQRAFWGRWTYVAFHLRHYLALLLAPALLILGQGLLRQFGDVERDWRFQLAALGLLILVFIAMPWFLRLALGLKPLPAGPLRSRLMSVAERVGFRCSNLLMWHTSGGVANAMVVGVLPRLRYVVFTDRLLTDLTPDEIEAVLGHEVGHVKHHHMVFYLGFLMVSLAVVAGIWTLLCASAFAVVQNYYPELAPAMLAHADWQMIPLVPFLAAYIFVVFGFLSRRCERQADIYGCRVVSCGRSECQGHDGSPLGTGKGLCSTGIHTFIRALEKVASLNGISRSRPGWLQSWQHSTIARRVEFLQRLLGDPSLDQRFQRRVAAVKLSLLLGLGFLLLVLATALGWDSRLQN